MGQRHNRRRTRPRSRNRSINIIPVDPVSTSRRTSAIGDSLDAISIHPAPTWHNGYIMWQKRERTPRFESTKMEVEQYRLCGGEPGDDVGLCYRMLEYFDGLDYMNTSQFITPLPG
ncbi:uncharacterized protein KD926_004788 [Aspergillus affinis]|uniref:uncharacterized protein n=1 Tax=Aspergillus affinis TaxID=1070780 RepID=UPI0022FE552D|nr:uncharacterized protein KD926_004788 [Aspergillus affinis]KAI9042997.1 hypothetical protein KD926_004788 [Aspergillus affinis]